MNKHPGYFVISLDFELFWGMFDKYTLKEYGNNVFGERTAIPRMLALFSEYGIHASWATVGMLMTRDKKELEAMVPASSLRPVYDNIHASSYEYMKNAALGDDEASDPYHFGPSLVKAILKTPFQDIENHTFSHFYCVDGKQNAPEIFATDLELHERISKTYAVDTTAIVFPRNQWSDEALRMCHSKGIRAYRGNENHFLYRARKESAQSLFIRGLRLLDHYVNISGHHTYTIEKRENEILNIPASRFFRPFMPKLSFLEPLRMRRIKKSMTHAAVRGEVFHLWWHPHNFGINQEENFKNLKMLLEHFKTLRNEYGMESASMGDIVRVADEHAA
jgi:peptidoglycan/xylan/chitin deacetylase (PgdA/CDA1 family)